MELKTAKKTIIHKILLLLNLLINGKYTRKELVNEFQKFSIKAGQTSILNYINKLRAHNITVNEEKINRAIYYSVANTKNDLELTKENLKVLNDAKNMLFAQKDYKLIRALMELFYKVSDFIKDEEIKKQFLNFGYFSTLNWGLIEILENHCKTKDIVILDYILPEGGNKLIWFHLDKISFSTMSQRLYLHGMFEGATDFFELPIDRIFMVKKVLRKCVKFNFKSNYVTYKVSKSAYLNATTDENEIAKEEDDFVIIKAPIINEFNLIQRILHFCPDVYYISEGKIKNQVREKLEILKSNYEKQPLDK